MYGVYAEVLCGVHVFLGVGEAAEPPRRGHQMWDHVQALKNLMIVMYFVSAVCMYLKVTSEQLQLESPNLDLE